MANAPNAGYLLIILNLQREDGLQPLVDEIDEAVMSWRHRNSDQEIEDHLDEFISTAELPLLTSTTQETLRYAASVMSIRRVTEPAEIGGYCFDRDDEIVCTTRSVHLDEEIYKNALEYTPRRYMNQKRSVDSLVSKSPELRLMESTLQTFSKQGNQSVHSLPAHAVHSGDRSGFC